MEYVLKTAFKQLKLNNILEKPRIKFMCILTKMLFIQYLKDYKLSFNRKEVQQN